MTDTSVEYSYQQQLIILWWCLGAGGFLSTIIFCCCLAVNKNSKNIRYNPPPLFSSANNSLSQTVTTSAARQAAAKLFDIATTVQQPPLPADSSGCSSLSQQSVSEPTDTQQSAGILQHLQLAVLQSADSSSANVVQEMMMFSHQALLHAGHLPSSATPAVSPLELSTRPPADVFAATEEMLMYTNAVLESMSMSRPHLSATARLPSRQLLVPISNAPDVSMDVTDSS